MNWVAPIRDKKTLHDFKEILKETDLKYYIMVEIGVGTGLQLQDILALKVKNVKNKDSLTVTIGTKHIERDFVFSDELKEAIAAYTKDKKSNDYLITGFHGKNVPLSREQAYRVLRNAGRKVGISSIGAQTMRKTFAWNYYQETHDIYYLQTLFNHASPSITYRFIGEKPNVSVILHNLTPAENERSRYMLFLNHSGEARLDRIIGDLEAIRNKFTRPDNNDAFYGKVDCLLKELEVLMDDFHSESIAK